MVGLPQRAGELLGVVMLALNQMDLSGTFLPRFVSSALARFFQAGPDDARRTEFVTRRTRFQLWTIFPDRVGGRTSAEMKWEYPYQQARRHRLSALELETPAIPESPVNRIVESGS